MAQIILPGNADPTKVLSGSTFSAGTNYNASGTMANNGAVTIAPAASAKTIPAGYHNGSGTVSGDANLVTGNIKAGVTIFGVAGATNVIDTTQSTGAAAAGNVLTGTSAYVNGAKITGSMANQGAVTLTPSGTGTVAIPAGYHNGSGTVSQVSVPAANVLTGTTIAGVAGTMANKGAMTFTPSTANQAIPVGYHNGSGIVQGDANLVAGNIKSGVSIFGVAGNVAPKLMASGTQTACQLTYTYTISGLAFTPTFIYLRYNWGNPTYTDWWVVATYGTLNGATASSTYQSANTWGQTNPNNSTTGFGNATISISGGSFTFTMGAINYGGTSTLASNAKDVQWIAVG